MLVLLFDAFVSQFTEAYYLAKCWLDVLCNFDKLTLTALLFDGLVQVRDVVFVHINLQLAEITDIDYCEGNIEWEGANSYSADSD